MLKLGTYNTLEIVRERDQGIYLSDDDGNEVLLPNKYVPNEFMIRDEIKVFLYLDHEERIVATTLEPYATVNSFAYLKCTTVSDIGAFMDWGLEKELFVPFREQASKMRIGSWYLVYVYLDEETNRLVGSSKTNAFLDNSLVLLSAYDEVNLMASHPSPYGWNMIVNQKHLGLVYEDEIFQKVTPGDQLKGFVKKVRPDGKIDLTLQRHGYRAIEPNAQQILDELKSSGGFIDLNDKSDPNDIKDVFQLSKKSFKKAIGSLYKAKKIVIEKDGIRLINED
ncbi:GntR family transcriptional regulator [Aquimarina sp. BL5]|uniref:CvfB family protein n=1 Tax=Aquimarina sp. BL5 TaxID=1714860 RepID=UPI000E49ADE6|nr:S1-like domain-containing RNA-binding protein [Aquimarina sp. BL5]AXT49895.1 GntR family transcriptional regulator [Aquimarina sp. BL5]RKM87665.1 GntR family transcriptional regulator [Aquimarina sp. BL5]